MDSRYGPAMQFLVQSQAADFKGPEGSLPWRDFANGEMSDTRSSLTVR
jgi:hypothetical protein